MTTSTQARVVDDVAREITPPTWWSPFNAHRKVLPFSDAMSEIARDAWYSGIGAQMTSQDGLPVHGPDCR